MPGRNEGFTLIELIIAVAIVAVLIGLAVPSFRKSIHDNQTVTASNGLLSALSLTRNTAIQRGSFAILCPTNNPAASTPVCGTDWSQGWIAYTAAANNSTPTSATLIRVGSSMSNIQASSGTASSSIVFTSRGLIDDSVTTVGTIIIKPYSCASGKDNLSTITLLSTGRAYATLSTCP